MGYKEDVKNMTAEFIAPAFKRKLDEGDDTFYVEPPMTAALREILAADLAEENRQLREEVRKLTAVIDKMRTSTG